MEISSKIKLTEDTDEDVINKYQEQLTVLCSTIAGTIPLDREFGIDATCLSQSVEVAEALLSVEIMEKVEKYIPELVVNSVDFEYMIDGKLTPIISVGYNDDNEDEEAEEDDDLTTDEDDYFYADEDDYDADEFNEDDNEEDEE